MPPIAKSSAVKNAFAEYSKERFQDLHLSLSATDGSSLAVSPEYLAGVWESGGGGTVGVISLSDVGAKSPHVTTFKGHKGPIQDIAFSPFYPTIFGTASDGIYVCQRTRVLFKLR